MSRLPFFIAGDAATEPSETDEAPVLCSECGRTECGCGEDPLCPHGHGAMVLQDPYRSAWGRHYGCSVCFCGFVVPSPEGRKRLDALNDPEVRRFINEDHRRRGGMA